MPCSPRKSRMLLKEEKARIIRYQPFTIQLTIPTGEAKQDIRVGIDLGAKHIGVAMTSERSSMGERRNRTPSRCQKFVGYETYLST